MSNNPEARALVDDVLATITGRDREPTLDDALVDPDLHAEYECPADSGSIRVASPAATRRRSRRDLVGPRA